MRFIAGYENIKIDSKFQLQLLFVNFFFARMSNENSSSIGMVDPAIFEYLQTKIDEDFLVREELRNILQTLEKQGFSGKSSCPKNSY